MIRIDDSLAYASIDQQLTNISMFSFKKLCMQNSEW